MKISRHNFLSILFGIVILTQLYIVSYRIKILIQIVVFAIIILITLKKTISYNFIKNLIPLAILILTGFLMTGFEDYKLIDVIKDITHLIKPILGLLIGYLIFKEINDIKRSIKTIIIIGVLCAVYHIFKVIIFSDFSLTGIRNNGLDNFFELFSLLLLIYSSRHFDNLLFTRKKHQIYLLLLSISCILYFSRTMIVVYILSILTIYGYTKINYRFLKVLGILIIAVALLYSYLFSIKIDRNGKGLEPFFYKIKIAPEEIFKTRIDRENHKELWDHWRGYEAKQAFKLMEEKKGSYIVGTGIGSLIDLKFQAPLGESGKGMRYISDIHNGYVYIFYKTGLIGLICMLLFLSKLYLMIYKKTNNYLHLSLIRMIVAIIVSYFFTTLVIMGIYNPNDALIFILGGLIFIEQSISKSNYILLIDKKHD